MPDVVISGPALAVATAARRLAGWTGWPAAPPTQAGDAPGMGSAVLHAGDDGGALRASISWHGAAGFEPGRPGSEVTAQALSGLMQVHGRDAGVPRRLGLDVASVTAGVLTTQALLAMLVARERGPAPGGVDTSVLEAALVLTSHYIAAATCRDQGDWRPPPPGTAPGPPFTSADGRRFEIETLDPEAWRRFWGELGAGDIDLSASWTHFRARFFRGACSLPPGLQEATARHPLDRLLAVAQACRVSLVPLRGYTEVLADTPRPGADGRARLAPLTDGAGGPGPAPAPAPATPINRGAQTGDGVSRDLPLRGIEVVEATSRIQGPLAGLMLQALGAHVTRVEPPGGDPLCLVPPYTGSDGYFFATFNHGKDAIELDLGAAAGRARLAEVAGGADVFIHNWGPGKAREWGLDASGLGARAPHLTYVEASGWGDPERNRRVIGTEFLVQAHAGMADGLTPADEAPAPSRVLLVDCLGALVACEGALGGLLHRARTGHGRRVDASLYAGAVTLEAHLLDALAAGAAPSSQPGRPSWGMVHRPLRTADGFLAVDAATPGAFARLCRLCGVDEQQPRGDAERAVAGRIRAGAAGSWEDALAEDGIPGAVIADDVAAIPADARLAPLFEGLAEGCRVPAPPWRFSR